MTFERPIAKKSDHFWSRDQECGDRVKIWDAQGITSGSLSRPKVRWVVVTEVYKETDLTGGQRISRWCCIISKGSQERKEFGCVIKFVTGVDVDSSA